MTICGCQSSTFFKIINMVLGATMIVYGVFDFITVIGDISNDAFILLVSFRVYEILFGAVLILSFCDFKFIETHFLFLKSTVGKGAFNMFLASMFLVGNDGQIWGYLMTGCFLICGLFFIIVGCCAKDAYIDDDLKSKEIARKAGKAGAKTAYENRNLLDD